MGYDRRVAYTKKVLKESLLALLQEKPMDAITVKEICVGADINRSTFYVYYGSPMELMEEIVSDLCGDMQKELEHFTTLRECMRQCCAVACKHRELLCVLARHRNVDILYNIFGVWKDDFMRGMTQTFPDAKEREMRFLFMTSGACSVLYAWILGNTEGTEKEIADILYACAKDCLCLSENI